MILTGLGAMIGALIRYSFSSLNKAWPIGTWIANVIGSFLLGTFTELHSDFSLFYIGITGSLTTFSTFTVESISLIEHKFLLGLLYIITTLTCSLLAFITGTLIL